MSFIALCPVEKDTRTRMVVKRCAGWNISVWIEALTRTDNDMELNNLKNETPVKRNVLYISVVFFALYVLLLFFFMWRNAYCYSFDEYYSLGSADLSFHTQYRRSPYMNYLVRWVAMLAGKKYYAMKLIGGW